MGQPRGDHPASPRRQSVLGAMANEGELWIGLPLPWQKGPIQPEPDRSVWNFAKHLWQARRQRSASIGVSAERPGTRRQIEGTAQGTYDRVPRSVQQVAPNCAVSLFIYFRNRFAALAAAEAVAAIRAA